MKAIVFAAAFILTSSVHAQQSYFNDRERGWFWYEKAEKEEEPKVLKEESKSLTSRELLKKQGEDWENALSTAILNPQRENIRQYLALTKKINEQSQNFSNEFQKTIWTNPEYDYTLERPVAAQAIIAYNENKNKTEDEKLKDVASKSGILFFFRSDCPHCHRFAPIMRKLSLEYGVTIIPVSLDGGPLPEFPYPKKNYEMGRKLNVSAVPAVFLVEPETNSVATVGYGYSDYSELKAKILNAYSESKHEKTD